MGSAFGLAGPVSVTGWDNIFVVVVVVCLLFFFFLLLFFFFFWRSPAISLGFTTFG